MSKPVYTKPRLNGTEVLISVKWDGRIRYKVADASIRAALHIYHVKRWYDIPTQRSLPMAIKNYPLNRDWRPRDYA